MHAKKLVFYSILWASNPSKLH